MYRFASIVLVSSVAFAQTAPAPEIVRAAKSPYDLARYIDSHVGFEWGPLWNALGVGGSLRPCENSGDCSTELITVLDPPQTILVIDTPWETEVYVRYLGSEKEGWRQAGAHSAFIKNYPRRHSMTRVGKQPFLRVASQGVSGSGVSSEVEQWFDLSRPEFKPVFSFTSQGSQNRLGFGLNRELHAFASPGINGQFETIEFFWTFSIPASRSTWRNSVFRHL